MSAEAGDCWFFQTRVIRRRALCPEHFLVTLVLDDFPTATPGQFVHILCHDTAEHRAKQPRSMECSTFPRSDSRKHDKTAGPMLRRPFSIAGLRRNRGTVEIDIMGRVVGAGTLWLDELKPQDTVDILGPLGRGFSAPPKGHEALLIAGGIGLPPLLWWGETLRRKNIACSAIYGVFTRESLPVTLLSEPVSEGDFTLCVEEFARNGIATLITTDDGSCGLKGRVTDGMLRYFTQCGRDTPVFVYACGPEPMLKAICAMSRQRDIPGEVAIERMMGCGMGTCQSCVVRVRDSASADGWRYALCCTEGPVFIASAIIL